MKIVHSLAELAALKKAMHEERRAAEAKAERLRIEQRERNLFVLAVGDVVPLRRRAVPPPDRPKPSAIPQQRERDEARVLEEAISDEFDVESLLETDDTLSFRRRGIGADVVRKLRRGVWAIQAQLDLHGLRRDEARARLNAFLHDAERAGLRCVRIVHGKGNGSPGRTPVLKDKVRAWLVQSRQVLAYVQARADEGGHGALVVLLRPTRA